MSTKEDIFNYVTTTPENTNPAVVRSLLDNLETSDGLPPSTEEDAGKVLTVGSTGAAEWAAAGGGNIHNCRIQFDDVTQDASLISSIDELSTAITNNIPIVCTLLVYDQTTLLGSITFLNESAVDNSTYWSIGGATLQVMTNEAIATGYDIRISKAGDQVTVNSKAGSFTITPAS